MGNHYSNAIYISSANLWSHCCKSGRIIAWEAVMVVEVASHRGSGCWCKTINLVCPVKIKQTATCSYWRWSVA